jgi:hypothetical protein
MARLLLDTNVIVRFLTSDHPAYSPATKFRQFPVKFEPRLGVLTNQEMDRVRRALRNRFRI